MFKQKFWLTIFVLAQLLIAVMIATGVWPQTLALVQLAFIAAALIFFDLEHALYSVILSAPFFLVIPNSKFDSFSTWRIAIAALFIIFLIKARIRNWREIKFMPWDKWLFWFMVIAALSVFVAEFKFVAIKKIAFVANIYLLYVLVFNLIKTKEQIFRTVTVAFTSLALIVGFGFVQFFFTFKTTLWNFWQYWATFVSRAYYGTSLANSEVYSNSWFNFVKNQPVSLRMFSILPDSHAFGVLAMFAVLLASALFAFLKQRHKEQLLSQRAYRIYATLLSVFIVLSVSAIVLSGTRGIWAAAIAPIAVAIFFTVRKMGKRIFLPALAPFLIFFILVGTSPLTQKILNSAHAGDISQRVASIYDLQDQGNRGRIFIWENTLKYAARHPFLGSGFGNFIVTLKGVILPDLQQYQELSGATESTFNLPGKYITAHNLYLDILAETGLLGFIFFGAWLWSMAKKFLAFFKKHYLYYDDAYVFFAVSIGLYMLWLFVYSLFDGTLINDRVLMFFFVILALAAATMKNYEQT